ncbi:DUF808 domain-containing protein [Poseidonocella sedimentorum]|uniref:Inner membrane protein YedI n=1 Tax=Poseidonocella sedimentorum TaxID=871652 RepID=A0A1I6DF68_9RHOB|nr:DUF808 domain-containing protein [Poseidonocella sedimentorum]SFR04021.1 hypothetical protein SAMN04515673_103103 [Poseidonocella sedimentorum]
MSGLLALLDDVAGIAKIAAASVDDVAAQALKAGSKAAGAVIDDAAVTPKYVHGFAAKRELPIIWKIARGSLINKLVFLLPIGLALSAFAPWLIPPLLMLGGAYLCFEGAEKIAHALGFGAHHGGPDSSHDTGDPAHLEEEKVAGAIKTDFILSAEIMTIALAAIPPSNFWMEAATLAAVAVLITLAVYGSVALIVKADDVGLFMADNGRLGITQTIGRGIVKAMPVVMKLLTTIGTAAMLWVGGSIIVHGLAQMGWHAPEEVIHHVAEVVGHAVPANNITSTVEWLTKATLDGLLGLILGVILIPVGTKLVGPLWGSVFGKTAAH